jgi:DNA-binding response OmpR family regulator
MPDISNIQASAESANTLLANELLDIELPLEPGIDWASFLQTGLEIAFVLIILAGLVYFLRFSKLAKNGLLTTPFILRWQLFKLKRKLQDESHINLKTLPQERLNAFYFWNQSFQQFVTQRRTFIKEEQLKEMAELKELSEMMAFSGQIVSRETYFEALKEAQLLLNETVNSQLIIGCLVINFKRTITKESL